MANGDTAATTITEHTDDQISFSLWIRFVFGGLAVFSGFVGLLNLASIASRYGFRWHADITQMVSEYQTTMYPLYDQAFKFAFMWLHLNFKISPQLKDAITIFFLSFAAANAESIIRDKRPLIANAMWAFSIISDEKKRKAVDAGMFTPIATAFDSWIGPLASFVLFIASLVTLGRHFGPFLHERSSWFYVWLGVGFLLLLLAIAQISVLHDIGKSLLEGRIQGPLPTTARALELARGGSITQEEFGGYVVVKSLLGISGWFFQIKHSSPLLFFALLAAWLAGIGPALPASIIVIVCLALCIATVMLAGIILFVLISPVVAWRTVCVTAFLFLGMMAANWMILHRML